VVAEIEIAPSCCSPLGQVKIPNPPLVRATDGALASGR